MSDLPEAKRNERPAGLGDSVRIAGVSGRLHRCDSFLKFYEGWRR
jgi:hypothetical protein